MKKVEDMSLSELKYQSKKIDWEKVEEYNRVDWVKDSIAVIRAKMKKVLEGKAE